MVMPFIVLGGIYLGIFTPTEAASAACVYALLVSHFVYKGLNWKTFILAVKSAANTTSMIFLVVAAAVLLAGPLTYANIPQNLTAYMIDLGAGKYTLILLSVVLFLFLGFFLDPLPILYLTIPILIVPLQAFKVDMTHFCIITIICMQIAQVTPPFGISLYTTSKLWDEPIEDVIKSSFPFLATTVLSLPIFIFLPFLSTWLPKVLMGE